MEHIHQNPPENETGPIPTPCIDQALDITPQNPNTLHSLAASKSAPRVFTSQELAESFFEIHRVLVQLGKSTEAELETQHQSYQPANFPSVEDDTFYQVLVRTVFNSGFRPKVIDRYLPTIEKYFSDYETVMNYNEHQLDEILNDPNMIRNKTKIQACYNNAKIMHHLVNQRGSIQRYLDEFRTYTNDNSCQYYLIRIDLLVHFCYLGEMTVLNFMTDLGFDAFKPDKAVMRTLEQFGLIDDLFDYFQALQTARSMSEGARLPLSYVVKVLKLQGQ